MLTALLGYIVCFIESVCSQIICTVIREEQLRLGRSILDNLVNPVPLIVSPPPRSIVVRVLSGCRRPGFDPRQCHTKDVKNGRFALLSLALIS